MVNRRPTEKQIKENKKNQKIRIKLKKSARRSGKSIKPEGKVTKSKTKATTIRSQKKIATIKKSRY